jgi:hypothetical protein
VRRDAAVPAVMNLLRRGQPAGVGADTPHPSRSAAHLLPQGEKEDASYPYPYPYPCAPHGMSHPLCRRPAAPAKVCDTITIRRNA